MNKLILLLAPVLLSSCSYTVNETVKVTNMSSKTIEVDTGEFFSKKGKGVLASTSRELKRGETVDSHIGSTNRTGFPFPVSMVHVFVFGHGIGLINPMKNGFGLRMPQPEGESVSLGDRFKAEQHYFRAGQYLYPMPFAYRHHLYNQLASGWQGQRAKQKSAQLIVKDKGRSEFRFDGEIYQIKGLRD